ncbi:branched-chain amino acid ABC transporter permease [soil metagenome]
MEVLLAALVHGLLLGAVYTSMVLSMWLLWDVARVVNLAHGDLVLIGAYTAWWLHDQHGWEPFAALLVVLPAALLVGPLLHRLVIAPLLGRPPLTSVLVTLGMSVMLQGVLRSMFTSMPQAARSALDGGFLLGRVDVPTARLVAASVAVVLVAATARALRSTKTGTSIRAVAQNREGARLVGIELPRVVAVTVVISLALAMAAGMLLVPFEWVQPALGPILTVKVFAVAAISGLRSVRAVVVSAVGLAVLEALLLASDPFRGARLGFMGAGALLVLALLVRPLSVEGALPEGRT